MADEKPEPQKTPDTITMIDGGKMISAAKLIAGKEVTIPKHTGFPEVSINWGKQDDYNKAYNKALESTKSAVDSDKVMQNLLKQKSWSLADREIWEQHLAAYVTEYFREKELFKNYRTDNDGNFKITHDLNDISIDTEFDCKKMSVTISTAMQRMDNYYLSEHETNSGFKKPTTYFLCHGFLYEEGSLTTGGHAYIISEATSSIIEATAKGGGSSYRRNANPNYSLAHYIAGYPLAVTFHSEDEDCFSVYTPGKSFGTEEELELMDKRFDAIKNGDFDKLKNMTSSRLDKVDDLALREVATEHHELIAYTREPSLKPELTQGDRYVAKIVIGEETITPEKLEKIKEILGEDNIRITNIKDSKIGFINYKGIRFPAHFSAEVDKTPISEEYHPPIEISGESNAALYKALRDTPQHVRDFNAQIAKGPLTPEWIDGRLKEYKKGVDELAPNMLLDNLSLGPLRTLYIIESVGLFGCEDPDKKYDQAIKDFKAAIKDAAKYEAGYKEKLDETEKQAGPQLPASPTNLPKPQSGSKERQQ